MNDYKEQLKQAAQFIHQYDSFLIVSHVNPDGDTISSSLAMALILKQLGKTFFLVNEDELPNKFLFLPLSNQIQLMKNQKRTFETVVSVDVADRSRMGQIDSLLTEQTRILNIDHHPTNDYFGDVNLILSSAAATAEVMYDLVNELTISFNLNLATCIYTGLLTDTGGFRYSNTSPKVMRIAAKLLEFGVSPGEIAEVALETITQNHIHVLKLALSKLEVANNGKIAWTVLNLNDLSGEIHSDDTEGIVNYCRNIEGVEVGVFFKETKEGIFKISLRSKKYINVGSIAKFFGGGGHARAAGYTFYGTIDEAKTLLFQKMKEDKGWEDNLEQ